MKDNYDVWMFLKDSFHKLHFIEKSSKETWCYYQELIQQLHFDSSLLEKTQLGRSNMNHN